MPVECKKRNYIQKNANPHLFMLIIFRVAPRSAKTYPKYLFEDIYGHQHNTKFTTSRLLCSIPA